MVVQSDVLYNVIFPFKKRFEFWYQIIDLRKEVLHFESQPFVTVGSLWKFKGHSQEICNIWFLAKMSHNNNSWNCSRKKEFLHPPKWSLNNCPYSVLQDHNKSLEPQSHVFCCLAMKIHLEEIKEAAAAYPTFFHILFDSVSFSLKCIHPLFLDLWVLGKDDNPLVLGDVVHSPSVLHLSVPMQDCRVIQ